MDVSLVIPLYNEVESLPELEAWIRRVVEETGLSYEIIFVDDGSNDGSWTVIEALHREKPAIRGIRFRRNYGKSAALNTGFEASLGRVVITLDADLQDSPDEIPELYRLISREGYDLVSGWKKKRHDPVSKTLPTKVYNWAARKISGIKNLHDFNSGLKAYRNDVVKNIEVYGEMHRYIPVIAKWAGFTRITEKVVIHYPRKYGTTKFGLNRFVNGLLDLLSIFFVGKFGKKPMHFFGTMGILCFLIGLVVALGIIGGKLWDIAHKVPYRDVTQQPWFFIGLVLILLGSQLFLTGFLAELVSRSATERNVYQIEKVL